MTAKEMWARYAALHPEAASSTWEAWAYGEKPDELALLTLQGVKTATASAQALYALEGEDLPQAGDMSVVLDGQGEAVCIVRNTRVTVVPFNEVGAEHARREGEGDRSLPYWRKVHERFFRREYEQAGLPFTDDIAVVCEEFEVVYP